MKKKRIKNDISVKWSLFNKESGEPFILSGKDVSLYLKNMYGRKAVEDFSVQDNQILWTFFGKDQKHTGKYSLELVVNKGVEGMITTDACDFVELVSCSCKAGEGTDECGVETETIEVQSKVEYVGGGSVTVDTELSETSMNPLANATVTAELKKKVNAEFGKGLSTNDFTDEAKGKLAGLLTIESLSDAEVLKTAFEKHHFADRLNVPIPCFIKEESHDEAYQSVILIVEKYPHDGYKLNFINIGATSQFKLYDENGVEIEDVYDQEWQWSPKCKLINGTCDSYLIPNNGYVIHLGKGELVIADDKLDASSDRPISNKGVANALTSTMYSAYFATYGEPSYERLQKEYANHKVCFCKKNKYIYALFSNDLTRNLFYFYCIIDNSVEIVVLDKNNNWTTTTTPLQEKLKDGQTIKTINGQSILGSGNLEILSETSVFEAVYGVTTYEELVAAVNAKKHVICFYNNRVYNLCNYQENRDIFFSCVTSAVYTVMCAVANGKWTASQYNFENTVYKVTSLSESSTDTQYPSAKAVYDFVQNSITNVLNEEV